MLKAWDADDAVRAIVLTGSGARIRGLGAVHQGRCPVSPIWICTAPISSWVSTDAIAAIRKPIIAAVAGFALGGGCELAMMCDFILAADNAKFGQPEINLGVMPGMGGTQRLTRFIGKPKAMEMCLTGRNMDAAEAERSGLVSRVVPLADLLPEAMKAAESKIAGVVAAHRRHDKRDREPRL